ncbi:MAG: homoserine dehydrogenase [Nitrososphaeria archaeon]
MKVQLIGLGNVSRSLIELLIKEKECLRSSGCSFEIVSVSDSRGTALDENGLNLKEILKYKKEDWAGFIKYKEGYSALKAIKDIKSDLVVELTQSTLSGEPGLSHIKSSLSLGKHVVTSNKGPLVVSFKELMELAEKNKVRLLYEATVAAHVPIFCLLDSCFIADEILSVEGIFNATTNFIIGEIEAGRSFKEALNQAIKAGWAEANYSDDVDGIDAARKVVILANTIYKTDFKLEDVRVEGIRNVEPLVRNANKLNKKIKLLCEIKKIDDKISLNVSPKMIPHDDPLSTVNQGDMGVKFHFKNSQNIFVSAQFKSPIQTAYAVLNDMIKVALCNNC